MSILMSWTSRSMATNVRSGTNAGDRRQQFWLITHYSH